MKLNLCPLLPEKVRLALCRLARFPVVGTCVGGPAVPGAGTVSVPVKSAGTVTICKVSLPMLAEECRIQSRYVPAAVSCASKENVCPGLLLTGVLASNEPEGKSTVMVADGFVTFVADTEMCWGEVVVKLRRTSCPATTVVAVTALPPIEIPGAVTS